MSANLRFATLAFLFFSCSLSYAQFTGNIQGTVQDPSGAGIAKAKIELVNTATRVVAIATSDSAGNYRFVSLAPGSYKITAEAPGFSKVAAQVTLLTEQNLDVPL